MNASRLLTLFLALALFGFVLLALSAPIARAADPVVVRVTTAGTTTWPCGDQSNWSNPCALQTALSNTVSGSELWVASGTYTPTIGTDRGVSFDLRDDIALYGGFAGGETLRAQRDVTAHVTILSGDIGAPDDASDNSIHVVYSNGLTTTAVLDGFTVTGGNADWGILGDRGGGLYNEGGSPTLANIIFSGNSASGGGAGMFNGPGNPTLTNVTFSGNSTSLYGGGMFNAYSSHPTLINVTFYSNTASYGGGMFNGFSSPTLINATFSGNSGTYGGAMANLTNCNPLVHNTVFWGDTAPNSSEVYDDGTCPLTISDSVVQGGYAGGTNIITTTPRLGAFGQWSGSAPTIPLLPGSSAIDAGNDATCASIPTDQRGMPRTQGTHCDIGAFESQGFSLTKTNGDNQSAMMDTAFANPLRVTVSSASGEPVNGGVVTFAAPVSGASAVPVTSTLTIASGAVTLTLTANGIAGSYTVTATTSGAIAPATFTLANSFSSGVYLPLLRR